MMASPGLSSPGQTAERGQAFAIPLEWALLLEFQNGLNSWLEFQDGLKTPSKSQKLATPRGVDGSIKIGAKYQTSQTPPRFSPPALLSFYQSHGSYKYNNPGTNKPLQSKQPPPAPPAGPLRSSHAAPSPRTTHPTDQTPRSRDHLAVSARRGIKSR